jgi:hypothetical protein
MRLNNGTIDIFHFARFVSGGNFTFDYRCCGCGLGNRLSATTSDLDDICRPRGRCFGGHCAFGSQSLIIVLHTSGELKLDEIPVILRDLVRLDVLFFRGSLDLWSDEK